jgi:hypothetical protein
VVVAGDKVEIDLDLTPTEWLALSRFMLHAQIRDTDLAVRVALCHWLIKSGYLSDLQKPGRRPRGNRKRSGFRRQDETPMVHEDINPRRKR